MRLASNQLADLLFQTVHQLRQARDLESLFKILVGFAAQLNFDRIIVCSVSPQNQHEWIDEVFFVHGNWVDRSNIEEREVYLRRCPITKHIFEYDEAFFWAKSLHKKTAKETYRIIKSPLHLGEVNGIQVPVFGRTGLEGAISFAGEISDMGADFKLTVQMVCNIAFGEILHKQKHRIAHKKILTKREKEVLKWAAVGQKHFEIADILKISERTIENHLRSIRKRLGVKSTAQAIASAIISREIEL